MAHILIVDDEAYRTRRYRETLGEAGHEVQYCSTFDEADEFLNDPDAKIDLLVQDLQMGRPIPTDRLQISNSEWERFHGLSGLWFLVRRRDFLLSRRIPVLILTQKLASDFQETLTDEVEKQGVDVKVCHKIHTPADRLPTIVQQYLAGRVQPSR
jgi:CheY-like chemotaxis protein